MSLWLKLELKNDHKVIVTNSETHEYREVNLGFIQDATHDSLSMLIQYKYYEVIINSKAVWSRVTQLDQAPQQIRKMSQTTSLVLNLKLKDNNDVIVTNSSTNESRTVTMRFMQEAAGDSLLMMVQYKYYELLTNTSRVWQRVKYFDRHTEKIKEIATEQKFRDIMVNDQWLNITEYDRQAYNKALASWATTYNSQPGKQSFDKFVFVPVVGGALTGALTYNVVGGMGIAAAGTAFGVGVLGMTALRTIGGVAAYGVAKAIN